MAPGWVIYLTHPEVTIDPDCAIERWALSDAGRARVARLAASGVLNGVSRVISSTEPKAYETATPLAHAAGCEVETLPGFHENDRSATGFLPGPVFERTADAFFAHPEKSTRGWETAAAAQARIHASFQGVMADAQGQNTLFVGHGAVGTLLYCALNGLAIDRSLDQPAGGGCYWQSIANHPPTGRWRRMEEMKAGG